MGKTDSAPDHIIVEFLQADGEAVRYADLGPEFMDGNNLPPDTAPRPFRVEVKKQISKAGNAFYDYSQNGVPLPDGLSTFIRVEGAIVPMGRTRPSKSGYPTREGNAQVIVGGVVYTLTVYMTESRTPYYVKVLAHKTPDRGANVKKAQMAPRGGRIVT